MGERNGGFGKGCESLALEAAKREAFLVPSRYRYYPRYGWRGAEAKGALIRTLIWRKQQKSQKRICMNSSIICHIPIICDANIIVQICLACRRMRSSVLTLSRPLFACSSFHLELFNPTTQKTPIRSESRGSAQAPAFHFASIPMLRRLSPPPEPPSTAQRRVQPS